MTSSRPRGPDSSSQARPLSNDSIALENGHCAFPEEHLSGALDGVLTRVERARVDRHLAGCERCGRIYEELALNRSAARTSRFPVPPDDQWSEDPRGFASRWARNLGWTLYAALTLVVVVLLLVQPELFEQSAIGRWLVRGALLATLAVLLSAAIDRWRAAKGDLYRGVHK